MLQRKNPLRLIIVRLAAIACFAMILTLAAQVIQAQPAADAPAPLESLRGRPDEVASSGVLGERFESRTTGLAFNPPAGMQKKRPSADIDQLALFVDPSRHWQLVATQGALSDSLPLSSVDLPEQGQEKSTNTGLLELASEELKTTHPAATILRQQVVKTGENAIPVGVLIARTSDLKPALIQQAILKAGDRVYFTLRFTSPIDAPSDEAPATRTAPEKERAAMASFSSLLETIELMDLREVKQDQNERLFRTRAFLVNLTPAKLQDAVIPEQWLRVIQGGKDIGYSYVIEEKDIGDNRSKPKDGVRVGVRTRLFVPRPAGEPAEAIAPPDTLSLPGLVAAATVRVDPAKASSDATDPQAAGEPVQIDAETWMWVSLDRRDEEWSSVALVGSGSGERDGYSEVGQSERQVTRYLDDRLERGSTLDENQPPVNQADVYTLEVRTVGKRNAPVPVKRPLAPWYIPQAIDHLLPRLLPHESKSYMFATYVGGERREVMNRYVDVLPARATELGGKKVQAIAIRERTGLEGPVTTHWLDAVTHQYLGSTCPESDLVVLPTSAADLEQRWHGKVDLTRPSEPATDPQP